MGCFETLPGEVPTVSGDLLSAEDIEKEKELFIVCETAKAARANKVKQNRFKLSPLSRTTLGICDPSVAQINGLQFHLS